MRATSVLASLAGALVAGGLLVTPAYAADPPTVDSILVDISVLSCDSTFAADQGAIQDDTLSILGSITAEEQGRISDALNARLRALDYCVGDPDVTETPEPTTTAPEPTTETPEPTRTTTPAPTVVDLDATDDDDSVARGGQVLEVPEGSAQTGAA